MAVYRYCTPEWLEASAEASRANPRFQRELAKLNTRVAFRVKAEPTWGLDSDIVFGGSVKYGELEDLRFYSEEEARRQAEFIMSATPQEWKKILRKEVKFVTEFMLGRIGLDQGSKVGVLSIAPHSNTFVDALTQHELQFPDEMSAEELAEFRAYVQQFRRELNV